MNDLIKKAANLFHNKKYQESLNLFQKVSKNKPNEISILIYISLNLMFLRNYRESLKILDKIILLNPKFAETYYNKALCFQNLQNYENAIDNYKLAINANPNYHQAYINYGVLLKDLGRYQVAIENYNKALDHQVNVEEIYINLSEVYKLNKNFKLAKQSAENVININDKNILGLNNLGTVLIDEGSIDQAIEILKKSKDINPDFFMTHINLGIAYKYSGQYEKAIESYQKALKLNPRSHDTYFNISKIQLGLGDFENGWRNYEHRWGKLIKRPVKLNFKKPYWSPDKGYKKLLIWAEQGVGEQILFSSILRELQEKFEKIILLIDDRLYNLYQTTYPQIQVQKFSNSINENIFDYHIPICSLGLFFRRKIEDFKPTEKIFILNKNKEVFNRKKLRCALSWVSKNSDTGFSKSISLKDLLPILKLENIEFYNIQYTNHDKEVEEFCHDHNVRINKIENLDTYNDLEGLMYFIDSCDFTLTVSNTNAHLSASIGKLTYLLLPKEMGRFWWWDNEKEGKNVWYPSIKKFNQKLNLNWQEPIDQLKKEIQNLKTENN